MVWWLRYSQEYIVNVTFDHTQGNWMYVWGTSRVCLRHVRGWFISRPGASGLNCISFLSRSNTGLFVRRAYSCLWPVAEPTAMSVCLAPDIGVCFVLEMATASYWFCHFTPSVFLMLQIPCGLLQTHWKQASAQNGSMTFSPFDHYRIFLHQLSHFCHV